MELPPFVSFQPYDMPSSSRGQVARKSTRREEGNTPALDYHHNRGARTLNVICSPGLLMLFSLRDGANALELFSKLEYGFQKDGVKKDGDALVARLLDCRGNFYQW
jgi:hypothetical protein